MPNSIVRHIVEGSITIASAEEFERIIGAYPNEPALQRTYADFLLRNRLPGKAAQAYAEAARLSLEAGQVLPALAAKILQWRLARPARSDAWSFYAALCERSREDDAVHEFFKKLSYPEFVAIILRCELLRLPAGKTVKKFGYVEDDLNFVVSGALGDTVYHPLEGGERVHRKSAAYLVENDCFGVVHPFSAEHLSQSHIGTITRTELIRIPKQKLVEVCAKFPKVEQILQALYRRRLQDAASPQGHKTRKAQRHRLAIKMMIQVFSHEPGQSPLVLYGSSMDISVGGVCAVLDANLSNGHAGEIVGRNTKVRLSLPNEAVALSILGRVAWRNEVAFNGKRSELIGIQFKEIPPKLGGFLVVFANILFDIP
jgi:CRP-like cAMP-binding protein